MNQVSIGIAIANTHGSVDTEQIYSFIESQEGNFETYKLVPPPGSIFAAGIDYKLILDIAGSATSIASILWLAYDKFIAPKKKKNKSAGIVIIIQKDNGANDQFWIGHTDNSKEIFIQTFSKKVDGIRRSRVPGESTNRSIEELRHMELWVRRK